MNELPTHRPTNVTAENKAWMEAGQLLVRRKLETFKKALFSLNQSLGTTPCLFMFPIVRAAICLAQVGQDDFRI